MKNIVLILIILSPYMSSIEAITETHRSGFNLYEDKFASINNEIYANDNRDGTTNCISKSEIQFIQNITFSCHDALDGEMVGGFSRVSHNS